MKCFANYAIDFKETSFAVFVGDVRLFELSVSSAVDVYVPPKIRVLGWPAMEEDIHADIDGALSCRITETESGIIAEYTTSSNLWQKKVYRICANESGFAYKITVEGDGTVSRIRYFASNAQPNACCFSGYLQPHAGMENMEDCARTIDESSQIALDYFAPPPFVFPFFTEGLNIWFGLGLFAEKGEHNFDRFVYRKHFCFELPLENRLVINGEKELPGIWGGYGTDAFDVIRAWSNWYYDAGLATRHADYARDPKWWKRPIFCGWGEQGVYAAKNGGVAQDWALQSAYEQMIAAMDTNCLNPGTIIIDDKWQTAYGAPEVDTERWPNLRSFADAMHRKGKKVLLWIKSWDAEGLPREECIDLLCNPVAADPTNPAYRERMTRSIKRLLSSDEGCCNCDGFKVDFINCIPRGEILQPYDRKSYGIELIRVWLELVYTAAKAAKSDAMINVSCAHPYMADVADQIRLHDFYHPQRSATEVMTFRQKTIKAVFGDVSCDTDGGGPGVEQDIRCYWRAQPKLGVPALYELPHSGDQEQDAADYTLLRNLWETYEAGL